MNRRGMLFAVLALVFTSSSAFAYEEARLTPEAIVLRVGQSADIQVGVRHVSGLNYTMWRFTFSSDRQGIIELGGTLDYRYPVWSGTIYVTARHPGTAHIISDGKPYATVEVVCDFVESVQAVVPVITARQGETVKLAVTTTTEPVRVLQWYAGRIGDTSHPLASNSIDLSITPAGPGTHYVWVSSKSQCASSAAEFRIDVLGSRRRAVGRR